jgi:predicted RNA-binding Zn ribbon-like protein
VRALLGTAAEAGALAQLAPAPACARSERDVPRYALAWPGPAWAAYCGPVAADALDLLTGPALPRLKACPARGCGWLFLDFSRNASRRWCSMESCGAREKTRRAYARSKGR